MNVPKDLLYTKEHEWVKIDGNRAIVGITDHAQHALGDIVFVELPGEGDQFNAGEAFGVAESVKAVSDLFAPVSGSVVEANDVLMDKPELLNTDAYGNWIIVLEINDEAELVTLLDAKGYQVLIEGEN